MLRKAIRSGGAGIGQGIHKQTTSPVGEVGMVQTQGDHEKGTDRGMPRGKKGKVTARGAKDFAGEADGVLLR